MRNSPVLSLLLSLVVRASVCLAVAGLSIVAAADEKSVSFVRDIQPIFARACTGCHGGVKQAGDISFVSPDSILPPDGWVIEPGDAEESILFQRLISTDPEERMPPPHEHPEPLADHEVDLIKRWIQEGAKWEDHWARAQLSEEDPPLTTASADWAKSTMDHFVFDRLRKEGLQPSRVAPGHQWLRRVTFDLVGLPPTLADISAFQDSLKDVETDLQRETVYRSTVRRLLASPRFGERWAAMWMDLARYADSQGFEKDPHRDMWPYREWLINAFNQDMPYDEFTIKQLAGDLLPKASYDDLIATAFHRNTQTNTEGGTDDEEYRIAAVIDRLSTTWTTWQATTFGCVQCHSHPYEPYDHEEFYAGLSMFNNSEDSDLNSETPTVPYLENQKQRGGFLRTQRRWVARRDALDAIGRQAVLQSKWQPLPITQTESTTGTIDVVGREIRVVAGTVAVGSTYTIAAELPDYVSRLTGLRITIRPESDNPAEWPEQGSVLSRLTMTVVDQDGKSQDVAFDSAIPDYRNGVDGLGEADCDEMFRKGKRGFGGHPKLFKPRWVVAVLKTPLEIHAGDSLQLSIKQDASVTGGLSNHLRRFEIEWTGSGELAELIDEDDYRLRRDEVAKLKQKYKSFKGARVPVMIERRGPARRTTRMFLRGNWLERGEVVKPRIPDAFQPTDPAAHASVRNRLEFAKWLVSKRNPLAARVWVNRIWAELFGAGIVVTQEDFGVSGQPPTHPELLDHLALKMQRDYRWSLKQFLESVVLSATYRQDSRASQKLRESDPHNQLLAHGPRTRLTAEMIRDQALVAADALVNRIGGPSVMPPQPDGVWQQVYSSNQWTDADDEDRYRRGVYTYWKRTSPYPGFVMFDTPSRDVCSPRRIATNTPLQALVTLNSEVYSELAGKLAEACDSPDVRESIAEMFLRVVSRSPSDDDLRDLTTLYESLSGPSATDANDHRKPDGEKADEEQSDGAAKSVGLKPLGIVALAILNSDWAITK
ncbi:PSD1 and planctomycete cytochrome C domain-containing protein [Stieleria marina]